MKTQVLTIALFYFNSVMDMPVVSHYQWLFYTGILKGVDALITYSGAFTGNIEGESSHRTRAWSNYSKARLRWT